MNNLSLPVSPYFRQAPTLTPYQQQVDDILTESANPLYRVPVFLSYATPYNELQKAFLSYVMHEIRDQLLFPRTLGVSEQSTENPVTTIRRMILSSFGMMCVAFRRVKIDGATSRPDTPREKNYTDGWLSSPYIQIESSMAIQQGLPLMLLVEDGVITDGVFGGTLEQGATPFFIPRFSLNSIADLQDFFDSVYWRSTFLNWATQVNSYYNSITNRVIY